MDEAKVVAALLSRKRKLLREIAELEQQKDVIVLAKQLTREERSAISAGAAIVAKLKKQQRDLTKEVGSLQLTRDGLDGEVKELIKTRDQIQSFNNAL